MEIKEYHSKTRGFFIDADKLFEKKSKFQKIELFVHDFYGKILRLDDYFQLSEFDEFIYHESLVHYPLFCHESPSKVLLIGGGDGAALREILKHPVKIIFHVELDKDVIEISKRFLQKIHKNSFDNEKVKTIIDDGKYFLENTKDNFDVIILDLTDPTGESKKLYTKEFYQLVKSRLAKNGILSLHIEQPLTYPKTFSRIYNTLSYCFKQIRMHTHFIPIYGTELSFALCSEDVDLDKINIKKIFDERKIKDLKLFSLDYFKSSLITPKYLMSLTNLDKNIITDQAQLDSLN